MDLAGEGINMKKTVIILLIFALMFALFACAPAPQPEDTQPPQQPEDLQPPQEVTPQETTPQGFTAEAEDDYYRYTGGGISILLEGGFKPTTTEEGYVVYTNGFLTVILARTDDTDTQMLSSTGYKMAELTEEDYASILVDANKLDKDCMFYDHFDNVCLHYTGSDSNGGEYEAYSVVKKDAEHEAFWLIQFIGAPAVYEPYSVFFAEWADSAVFY